MYENITTRIDALLTGPFVEAFKAVDCRTPAYDSPPMSAAEAFRATVQIGHVAGTP